MFGMVEAMLSFLRRQVGLRNDVADSAGSLHAKTVDIKNYLTNSILPVINKSPWVNKSVSLTYGYSYSSVSGDGAYHDIFRITGPRIVLGGYIQLTSGTSGLIYKGVLDNLTLFDIDANSMNGSGTGASVWECTGDAARNAWAWRLPEGYHLHYKSSSPYTEKDFDGTMIVLPPLLPIQTTLAVQYKLSSGSSVSSLAVMWGIWHVAG